MSKTHWKKLHNPNYLGAYALEPGKDLTVKIKDVRQENVTGPNGTEECLVLHLYEQKPLILNVTNSKAIAQALQSNYIEDWAGQHIALYIATVSAFGQTVDAVRVRPVAPRIEKPTLPEKRFAAMIEKIKTGDFSVEQAREKFSLTPEQSETLNAIQS